MICRFCGKQIQDDAVFCKYCGKNVEIIGRVCDKCGKALPDDAVFCTSCGAKVENSQDSLENAENSLNINIEPVEEIKEDITVDNIPSEIPNNKPSIIPPEVLDDKTSNIPPEIRDDKDSIVPEYKCSSQRKKPFPIKIVGIIVAVAVLIAVILIAVFWSKNDKGNDSPPLPLEVFDIVVGRYISTSGGTITIISPSTMTKAIKGTEDVPQEMTICKFKKRDNGYVIYAEWMGEKNTYYYEKQGEMESLVVGYDSSWDKDDKSDGVVYTKNKADNNYSTDTGIVVEKTEIDEQEAIPNEEIEEDLTDTSYSFTVIEDEMGGLPVAVFDEICGHYDDGSGDTVDIFAMDRMVRFILGGNQSHTYDEEICGYKVLDRGFLLKVQWDGEKYTYLYTKKGDEELLLLGYDDGWDPELNPYNYIEGVQEYRKTSDSVSEKANESVDTNSTQYMAGYDDIKKEGEYYYLCPVYVNEKFWPIGEGDPIPFPMEVKISKNAKIGVATSFYTTFNGDYDEIHFTHDYYDFYETADKFFANKHWYYRDTGELCFSIDGNELPLAPIVTFDENGDINMLLENYSP